MLNIRHNIVSIAYFCLIKESSYEQSHNKTVVRLWSEDTSDAWLNNTSQAVFIYIYAILITVQFHAISAQSV